MLPAEHRVEIWNTFFKLAWQHAKSLYESSTGKRCDKDFEPEGGTLPDEEFHALATLVLCNLAIEARTNHLIDELIENGILSKDAAEAAKWLPTKHKWFLLPALAKTQTQLDSSKMPHQAVAMICSYRDRLIHVKYESLKGRLPSPANTICLLQNFWEAMENMNVVLGRVVSERKEVLNRAKFE